MSETQRISSTTQLSYSFQRLKVAVIAGTNKGEEAICTSDEISVGTDLGNDLVLTDETVSRHHCVFSSTPGGIGLRDLGSTNGTNVGAARINDGLVPSGAEVRLGQTVLRVEALDDELSEPLRHEGHFGPLMGASAAMRRVFSIIERVAASESTVLLEGETGTGKTLIAEEIHKRSRRAHGPFVVVDCGAIPPTLVESELFGHEKGSFTGATAARAGAFESANGGTVFLDEIGELPLEMQPKLLRAIENRVVKRLGAQNPIELDLRLIAATNRDLRQEVNQRTFRSDLYYRLNVLRLRIPPLRERRDDVAVLVAHFYEQFAGTPGSEPPAELLEHMLRRPWPGNVRELRAAVERAVLLGDPNLWSELSDSDPGVSKPSEPVADVVEEEGVSYREAKARMVNRFERDFLVGLMERSSGNLTRAARDARMDRGHLRELLRRHNVRDKE